jgi:hypothetical protein
VSKLNFNIPRPMDSYEQKLYIATKISINGLYNEKDSEELAQEMEARFWNIYFWNIFSNRSKKVDCSRYIIEISRPKDLKIKNL